MEIVTSVIRAGGATIGFAIGLSGAVASAQLSVPVAKGDPLPKAHAALKALGYAQGAKEPCERAKDPDLPLGSMLCPHTFRRSGKGEVTLWIYNGRVRAVQDGATGEYR